MSRFVGTLVVVSVIGLVLGLLGVAGLMAWGGGPLAQAVVTIDGNQVTLAQLHGGAALFGAVALLVLIVLVFVVPFAVLLPLLLVGLGLVCAFVALLGTAALLLSPLILLGWLIWRLARPQRRAPEVVS
jgi:hypothetical protein